MSGFRLSPLQEELWRRCQERPQSPCSARVRVRITGALVAERLPPALEALARRHEILRARFVQPAPGEAPLQVVEPRGQVAFESHDLSAGSPEEAASRTSELERALELQPGDGSAPLRAALLRLGPSEHRLLLSQSALAADWRSLWNLARELALLLAGSELQGEPLQVTDLAQWQRDALEGDDAALGLDHWQRLPIASAQDLRLPFEHGAPGPNPLLCTLSFPLPRLAPQRVPAQALFLSAWQVLLGRFGERTELVLALRSPGRAFQGLQEALGPLARFLPIAAQVDEKRSWLELARAADERRAQAEEWHELYDPERLKLPAGFAFPHAFEWLPREEPLSIGDLCFELEERRTLSEPFCLLAAVEEHDDGPCLHLTFDERLLDPAGVASLAASYQALLADGLHRADCPARSLALLAPAQRTELLQRYSRGPELAQPAGLVHEWLLSAARERVAATAVRAGGSVLDYAELERRSARLAAHLQALGVGPGQFVGLHLAPSTELVVALLAVLRAGGAYLPLPPGYPAERLRFMLADSGTRIVLGDPGRTLGAAKARIVELDAGLLARLPDARPEQRARPQDFAYVIYTSGSTGQPKGVAITHANLAASTAARLATYPGPVGAYLLLSSFAFDSSVAGIFWTLARGGALVLPAEGFERDLLALPAAIREHGVTHLLCLPSLWSLLLEQAGPAELASLRTVIVAGESCPPELVRRHAERLPAARLYNEYGPTEGTVWSTVFDCSQPGACPEASLRVPIGRPIPGARAYVLDEYGEPLPIGLTGELWIGGPGVAPGYLGRPELTAERFRSDPFGGGERMYRTGDRARFLADGNLEFLGRSDQQVKVRGFRIELAEIEAALCAHPAVREALVQARERAGAGTELAAYFTSSAPLPPGELRAHLAARLPEHMLPAHLMALSSWPRLPNGKIDRQALPEPIEESAAAKPEGALEAVLAALFADVLGLERVGRHDDFFALGGHSLLATRLYARLKETLQVPLPLRALFEQRTPAALAAALRRDPAEAARVERLAEVVLQILTLPEEEGRALGA
jgi:amino acid adenylation domain-containing protein